MARVPESSVGGDVGRLTDGDVEVVARREVAGGAGIGDHELMHLGVALGGAGEA